MAVTRVAIVAGSPMLRAGLESLLGASSSLVVVGTVAEHERESLLDLVAPLAPDVVVWVADRAMDDAIAALRAEDDGTTRPSIVVLVDEASARDVARAVRFGVRAVLPRAAGGDEIAAAVDAVAAGFVALPLDIAAPLLADVADEADDGVPVAATTAASTPLTAREREVLALLAQGLANKAIAPRLGISEHTVKAHVAAIFEKLGAGTRAEAVVLGARAGVLLL